jgi:hypothetical protein
MAYRWGLVADGISISFEKLLRPIRESSLNLQSHFNVILSVSRNLAVILPNLSYILAPFLAGLRWRDVLGMAIDS